MNSFKLRYHRKNKRHEKQVWKKEIEKISEEEIKTTLSKTIVKRD